MVAMRQSPTSKPNPSFREEKPSDEGNHAWLKRHGDSDGILLLGGTSVADFRVRIAQSLLRRDMTPSHWSICGILLEGGVIATVPFDVSEASAIPYCNGIRRIRIEAYDDPKRFPNIAVIRFAEKHDYALRDIDRIEADRSIIDLPALILPWLGYIWGVGSAANPLEAGTGVPSAAFVETIFAMAGFELTPGLASASSCPEAIWQSAKWWTHYYTGAADDAKKRSAEAQRLAAEADDKHAAQETSSGAAPMSPIPAADDPSAALPMVPTGSFMIRQRFDATKES